MRTLIYIATIMLLIASSCKQSHVTVGRVKSAETGAVIKDAEIQVVGSVHKAARSNKNGFFHINTGNGKKLIVKAKGYEPQEVIVKDEEPVLVSLVSSGYTKYEVVIPVKEEKLMENDLCKIRASVMELSEPKRNTEDYSPIVENGFKRTSVNALSTFSIDVDNASYSNVRRFINNGTLPPIDAVRSEELINYFYYNYEQPKGNDPVGIYTEVAECPWNTSHKLAKIGVQARSIATQNLPASNLVFLIDVSGSMDEPAKLPLLVNAFKLLVNQLRETDKVSIVVYAGSSGVVLAGASGNEKMKINEALSQLMAGGSTAGGEGIMLAYKIARQQFIKNGNNRVILATDGDFNVGVSSDGELMRLIEEERKSGVFLSVLGFGMGNYKDNKLELLADKGNGNYAYIDSFSEARKVFVNEFGGTLFTVAKDVKLQVEFNPALVQSYRLIGYENRLLNDEDFNNDKIDAGEMGSGQTVTALYEIIPVGVSSTSVPGIDPLKYQKNTLLQDINAKELLTVKLRYKEPTGNKSKLISTILLNNETDFASASVDFRFAAAVAEFGMLLRNSPYKNNINYDHLLGFATKAIANDEEGYKNEFLGLIRIAKSAKKLNEPLSLLK